MFAYCGNNPVFREDNSGRVWGAILIGAGINLVTSYLAAKVTNQQFTLMDGLVAAAAGGVGAILPGVGGLMSGAYTAYMAYENGATVKEAVFCGAISFSCTAFSMGGVSSQITEGFKITGKYITQAFVNTTFSTAYNSISAATYRGVVNKAQKKTTVSPSPGSTNTVMQPRIVSYYTSSWMNPVCMGK